MNNDPAVIVIFGATGDLAVKKLLPGLFRMYCRGMLPDEFAVVGSARRNADLREVIQRQIGQHADLPHFLQRVRFVPSEPDLGAVAEAVREAAGGMGDQTRTLLYLAVPPAAMPALLTGIQEHGLNGPRSRVVVEKPFGFDLTSAQVLDDQIDSVFTEPNVFRIDHFLGKEDVTNLLALRFGNRLFETFWCAEHIDQIEVDVPEAIGVGERAGFYDRVGAYRDMVVTHLFQVLGFVAMEPPASLSGSDLAAARFAVFDALRPIEPGHVVRGVVAGYEQLPGVDPARDTETFVAVRTAIDNDRWRGVPVVLRTGKRMAEGRRIVSLRLRPSTVDLFGGGPTGRLVFEVGAGSVRVDLSVKRPGPGMDLQPAVMTLDLGRETDDGERIGGYERLLFDALQGDHTLFTTARGIERLWAVSEPLLEDPPPAVVYEPGSWGPEEAARLAPHGWYLPS